MSDTEGDDRAALLDNLRLMLVPGVGPVIAGALIQRFGSARRVLDQPESVLREVRGVGPGTAEEIHRARQGDLADIELELCEKHGVTVLARWDDGYPPILGELPDPPALLYVRGSIEPVDRLAVALVGARKCTPYGARIAERLAASLARVGVTVVSGLARGIDAAAHRGALAAGGRTIAVLANGLAAVYPPEHEDLARAVVDSGALLSEVPMRYKPLPELFPRRNRVISGLSLGVVVVEAAPRSGSLSTARHATDQNREVFAVPGPVDSLPSRGCHGLIRDGAKLVETVEDILEELGPLAGEVRAKPDAAALEQPDRATLPGLKFTDQERKLIDRLDDRGIAIDELIAATGLTPSQVMATLSVLEMRRLVRRLPGPRFARA